MIKRSASFLAFMLLPMMLSGCGTIGSKSASLSMIYAATAVLSLLMLVGYCLYVRKRDIWFLLLFVSVLVVNVGYLSLSISNSLEEALLANRISYFGSVFLPMSMLMSILDITRIRYKKPLPVLLLGIGIAVFLIAASPGYLDIYYKEVFFENVNGIAVLNKVYGPWHKVYLFYLLGYFTAMVAVIRYAAVKKKIESTAHAMIIAIAVLVNIGVWLLEQLVKIDFEFLSVSYIISGIFLVSIHLVIQDYEQQSASFQKTAVENMNLSVDAPDSSEQELSEAATGTSEAAAETPVILSDKCQLFLSGLAGLTQTERAIYDAYIAGKTTQEIMVALNIKENTLKFHNKNLYSKLGVSSRKQLMEVYRQINATEVTERR